MLNYWWVTRPKRKLDQIPDVLRAFANISLDQSWNGELSSQLAYESALENLSIKRTGQRVDQSGGGARTYKAWLASLGLIYTEYTSNTIKLTDAGLAILNNDNAKEILSFQVLKYQFPSSFSVSKGVQLASRFRVHPFQFLLKLLSDSRIGYLTEEEIAKVVVIHGESDTAECLNDVVDRIMIFRKKGDSCLEQDFFLKYQSSKGGINLKHPYSHLTDLANTICNWLSYTNLVQKNHSTIVLNNINKEMIDQIINMDFPFIDHPENHELFQKEYGTAGLRPIG